MKAFQYFRNLKIKYEATGCNFHPDSDGNSLTAKQVVTNGISITLSISMVMFLCYQLEFQFLLKAVSSHN